MWRCAIVLAFVTFGAVACGGDGDAKRTPTAVTTSSPEPTATPRAAAETLAFLRDGDIWLVNADGSNERRLNLTGVESFAWVSADEIDVTTEGDPRGHLLVGLSGSVRGLPFPTGGSWSQDRTRYVTVVEEQLVVFNRDGGEVARLTVTPPLEDGDKPQPCGETLPSGEPDRLAFGRPVFSPDGESIFVAVNCFSRAGANTFFKPVVEVSLDGTVRQVTPFRVNTDVAPGFSPDGKYIAQWDVFHLDACAAGATLTVADVDGANARLLQPAALSELTFLTRRPVRTPLPTPPPVPHGGVVGYDWSPQSDALVAGIDVSLCPSAGAPDREPFLEGLFILRLDGTEERLLEEAAFAPAWSPSGRYVAFVTGYRFGNPPDTGVVRVLDLTNRQVLDLGPGASPAWRPLWR